MTKIKTYLKLDDKEIDTISDFIYFIQSNNKSSYQIELLIPVLGKFVEKTFIGHVALYKYCKDCENEMWILLAFSQGISVKDVMLSDIHRSSKIIIPYAGFTWDKSGFYITLGRKISVGSAVNDDVISYEESLRELEEIW